MRESYEESDSESMTSACSSSSIDEDEVNVRIAPAWCSYRDVIGNRGFRLDTCRDVKQYYQRRWDWMMSQGWHVTKDSPGYVRACNGGDDDELCRDAGLPENLFRGTRCSDSMKVVIKAVHSYSREYDIVRDLSTPPLRDHPMNHCIPILDLIDVPQDKIAFIVMEEWDSPLLTYPPSTLRCFLAALRQQIEHIVFMHSRSIAHLDISLRNVLTDSKSRYACIDFETSRRFHSTQTPRVRHIRGTETPPEVGRGEWCDPYKVDVWALAVFMLRACKVTGYNVPELVALTKPMLHDHHEQRPTAREVLNAFNAMVGMIGEKRLDSPPS